MHRGALLADLTAAGAIVGTIAGYFPLVAAIAGFVWYSIQIWEWLRVQNWYKDRAKAARIARIAKLEAKRLVLEERIAKEKD